MSNTLGNYDPIFYAQEALIALNKALGMAGRVPSRIRPQPAAEGGVINITRALGFRGDARQHHDRRYHSGSHRRT